MAAEKPVSKGQAWFCTTGLPSDIVIEVGEMSFHLHKFPLMSRSRRLHQLITEQEQNLRQRKATEGEEQEAEVEEENEEEIEEEESYRISLADFPGGSETFEAAAKFSYGVKIEMTSWNVASLRCAAEYLEMTDEYSEDNLISRSEGFLAHSVLRNLKESVRALKSCEVLMPLAEALEIPQRCINSIAAKACSLDPRSLFGWPVNEGPAGGNNDHQRVSNLILWNGIDTGHRRKSGISSRSNGGDSWFEDLTVLSLPLYKRVISAMKDRDLSLEVIEGSLISYAKKSIPGLSRSSRKSSSLALASEQEQRELLETVITNLPVEKSSGLTTTRFCFGLLRTVNILRASEASREALERKIASQLEQATLDDLLMPSYSYLMETLYDVDCVERILGYFLEGLQERFAITGAEEEDAGSSPSNNRLMLVAKLIDGYLSEIASDANLKPDKFCDLAHALPDHARLFDDGLYRAVDVYLKAHPRISEAEREKICGVMDCQKLTLEACTHAAQNERLPLRAIVQVLFLEQLQLRHAIAGSLLAAEDVMEAQQPDSARDSRFEEEPARAQTRQGDTWRLAVRDNQVLRLDMDSMRSRVHELERECSSMKKVIEKMDRTAGGGGGGGSGGWSTLTRRFGCKFKTQVCHSHEGTNPATVADSRKYRTEQGL